MAGDDDEKQAHDERPSDSDAVGYRKPPKHTRFQPGQSGNPRGRTGGTRNLKTDLLEELGETILVREGDLSRRVSKQRGVVKSLVARTLKGDARAASLLLSTMMRLIDTGAGAAEMADPLSDDEREILEDFAEQWQRRKAGVPVPPVGQANQEDES